MLVWRFFPTSPELFARPWGKFLETESSSRRADSTGPQASATARHRTLRSRRDLASTKTTPPTRLPVLSSKNRLAIAPVTRVNRPVFMAAGIAVLADVYLASISHPFIQRPQ